jgi:hypothetical protein
VSGVYSGIGQGILRVSAQSPDASKRAHLRRAFKEMSQLYPGKTLYTTLTANVILRSDTASEFSVYFGQSFGSAKSVYYGQEHDPITGRLQRLFTEFALETRSDLEDLPVNFTTEDFSAIYKRNFARSGVSVHRVLSLVYIFSVGIENYEQDHTQPRTPLRIF